MWRQHASVVLIMQTHCETVTTTIIIVLPRTYMNIVVDENLFILLHLPTFTGRHK